MKKILVLLGLAVLLGACDEPSSVLANTNNETLDQYLRRSTMEGNRYACESEDREELELSVHHHYRFSVNDDGELISGIPARLMFLGGAVDGSWFVALTESGPEQYVICVKEF